MSYTVHARGGRHLCISVVHMQDQKFSKHTLIEIQCPFDSCESINSFEVVALNVDTNKTQNLELLLDAADFAKLLAMENFKNHELHKAVGCKATILLDSDQWC